MHFRCRDTSEACITSINDSGEARLVFGLLLVGVLPTPRQHEITGLNNASNACISGEVRSDTVQYFFYAELI